MRFRVRTALVATVPLLAAGFLVRGAAIRRGADLFSEVFSLVRRDAVDSVGPDALYEKAARGLVHAIGDPYAELYTRDEIASFNRENLGGAYGGLGMQIEDHSGRATISRVFPRGPAAIGGLRAGGVVLPI